MRTTIVRPLSAYLCLLAFCLLVQALPACSKNQRSKTIHATLVSVDAVREGFVTWDRAHMAGIVEGSTSHDDGTAKLLAYRAKRQPILDGFEVAYRALVVAATQSDDPSLKAALAEAVKLIDSITKLRGGT